MPSPVRRQTLRSYSFALALISLLAASAWGQEKAGGRLSRFVPAEGLAFLIEHDGFASAGAAWDGSATRKLLGETPLGPMLRDILTQLADRGLRSAQGAPLSGEELISLLLHAADRGFAIGFAPTPEGGPPRSLVFAVRGAKGNAIFGRVLGRIAFLNPPQANQVDGAGGRTLWAVGPELQWWYEGDDFVLSFSADQNANPALDAALGRTANASTHPGYKAAESLEGGTSPVGRLFVDLSVLPPVSENARELGLGAIRRIDARWGIQEKAIVVSAGVEAPRPRRGVLALFDQPPLPAGTEFVSRDAGADSLLLSLDLAKLAATIKDLAREGDPQAVERLDGFAGRFRDRTGLSLSDDVLAKIGPRMAFVPGGGGMGNVVTMWFRPPDFGLVAELKDARGFASTLDRLIESANRELRSIGGMVPPRPGAAARPGTQYAEFRKLKPPEHGYVLAVPPAVLPTPAGLRPAVLIDAERGLLGLGGSPAAARRALSTLRLAGGAAASSDRDAFAVARTDPSQSLPDLLVNLPALVQFIGFAATQQPGPASNPGLARRGLPGAFRLEIDPDRIPEADQLRPYLFPSRFALAADERMIKLSTYQAFPLPLPSSLVGSTETPVLIALLLPAVQSAREAARRAQCVNNLKQIGLAMHNYESVQGTFPPPAITGADKRPLLSWRVALLPYLDQKPLYDKFHLDEPWDSPHNRELIKYMPQAYVCPSRPDSGSPGLGTTSYRLIVGKGAMFEPDHATRLAEITDGTSNTLMVVESRETIPWTRPEDLPFDPDQVPAPGGEPYGLGSFHPGGFNAAFADGSVRFLKSTIAPIMLKALITRQGGEVVPAIGF